MRGHPLQNNFTAGEFSPRLDGRVDIQRYANAVARLENFLPLPHGGAVRRAGSHFVAEVKTSSAKTRIIGFEFSDVQAYALEFGNQYIRFYMNSGRIESPPGTPYEIASPWITADLPKLKFVQSADVMYLVHPSYAPRKLTRTDHTAWTLTTVDFQDGPYRDQNTDASKTLTPSATTGTITITATGHTPFVAGHVGSIWRIQHSSQWGCAKVTAFTDSSHVTAVVQKPFGGVGASSAWREGAWSDVRGYPGAVTFFEERLFFAGTPKDPQTIDGSMSGDYETFSPTKPSDSTVADDNAVRYTIAANKVNLIRWLFPSRVLLVGTQGGEFRLTGGVDKALTPANVDAKSETDYGSNLTSPQRVGNVILFVQRSGRRMRELAFSLDYDAYVAPDLTVLAEHIFPKGKTITEMFYQQTPDPIVWAVRSDGLLASMTYDRQNDVVGWARHPMDGSVDSVTVIAHPDGDREQVWLIVNRTINGATKRYVEYLDDINGFYDTLHTDCALTYDAAPATTFGGLDHLRGKTVDILGDGAVYPQQTVPTSGNAEVTITPAASKVEVGLHYVSALQTLRLETPMGGTTQGRLKKWSEVIVRFVNSLGFKINGDRVPFRLAKDPMGSPPPLFTGDQGPLPVIGWDREGRILIEQDQPLPCHIIAITGTIDVSV